MINYKRLPDYVFDTYYEGFAFVWFEQFFNRREQIIEEYISLLKKSGETEFSMYEILDDKSLYLLSTYNILTSTPVEIATHMVDIERHNIHAYMPCGMEYCTFISKKNKVCIYGERDLEVFIIGCDKETAHHLIQTYPFIFLDLNRYTSGLERYYPQIKEKISKIIEALRENYSR